METQYFKPEQRFHFNEDAPGHPALADCPWCGTGYIDPIGKPQRGGYDNEDFVQRHKCSKPWCRAEFDVVYRAVYAQNIVIPERQGKRTESQGTDKTSIR
jgi:hypothetical protein